MTIGNFDGVHRGHRAVMDQLAARRAQFGLPSVVMIFEPQPLEFFRPDRSPPRLTRLREKLSALNLDIVDRVLCVRFDEEFAAITAEEFVDRILVDGLAARFVLVGDDFRFGQGRSGDYESLQAAGRRHGFDVGQQATFVIDGKRVSSTAVREALGGGDLERAATLLGYPFAIHGRVAHGDQRGRTLGYPTANIHLLRRVVPLLGVFACQVRGVTKQPAPAVANLGYRPTIAGGLAVPILEVHLLDFSGNLYGRHVRVEFLFRIREERKFDSYEELRAQIERDEAQARAFFDSPGRGGRSAAVETGETTAWPTTRTP